MQSLMLIKFLCHALALLLILRFLAQFWRVDRYNPIVDAIARYSDWLCAPLRRLLPGNARLDMASLSLGWLVLAAWLGGVLYFLQSPHLLYLAPYWGLLLWFSLLLQLYFFLLLALVVISWVAPGSRHPLVQLVYQFTEPLSYPIRRFMPGFMGLDFSPMVIFFLIYFLRRFVVLPLMLQSGLPMGLTVWI